MNRAPGAADITKGGLGCAKAHTALTSPLSQPLYLRIFLPLLHVIAAKQTNSSWHVKVRKGEKAPGPDGFTLPPAWTPLLCHRKAEWPPDRGYHMSLQLQAQHSLLAVHKKPGLLHMVITSSKTHHQGLGPIAHPHQTALAERLRAGLETCWWYESPLQWFYPPPQLSLRREILSRTGLRE